MLGTQRCSLSWIEINVSGDFPGGPAIKTLPSNAGSVGSILGQGTKIPQALWSKNQNIKQKQYCNKFNTLRWSMLEKREMFLEWLPHLSNNAKL